MFDLRPYLRSPNNLFSYPIRSGALNLASWCAIGLAVLLLAALLLPAMRPLVWSSAPAVCLLLILGGLDLAARARRLGGLRRWQRNEQHRRTRAAKFGLVHRFGDNSPAVTELEVELREQELRTRRRSVSGVCKMAFALLKTALVGSTGLFVTRLLNNDPGAWSTYLTCLSLIANAIAAALFLYPLLRRRDGILTAEIQLLRRVQFELLVPCEIHQRVEATNDHLR